MSAEQAFQRVEQAHQTGGTEAALDALAEELREQKQFFQLFDALLMKHRFRLGLPVGESTPLEQLKGETRDQMEEAYIQCCREVGTLLLDEGRVREAWMYLRPLGETETVAEALRKLQPDDENLEEVIELSIGEGIDCRHGFELVLEHYGTCNAVTYYEQSMFTKPVTDQRKVAGLLVKHLHEELAASLKADIERQQGSPAEEASIRALVEDRDWLFTNDNYHIDTSHLNSVVRYSLVLDDSELLKLAIDLTEYGRRLSSQFHYGGEEPFTDTYVHYGLFLKALLGESVDEALAHFSERAKEADRREHGTAPAEVYVALLARLGRYEQAMDAVAELLPPGSQLAGFAPGLLELGRLGRAYERLRTLSQQRGDLLGFAAGLVEENREQTAAT